MAGSERVHTACFRVAGGMMIVVLGIMACADFTHTNPYDLDSDVTLTLTGPDSATAVYDTLRFTLTTTPAFEHDPPTWTASEMLERIDDAGTYRIASKAQGGGQPVQLTVTARIGPRTVSKTITFVQRQVALIARSCSDTTKALLALSFEDALCVSLARPDRHGVMLLFPSPSNEPTTTVRIRDTSIVRQWAVEYPGQLVTRRKNGSTYVVFSQGGFSDSVSVTVQQRVALLFVNPTSCTSHWADLKVGETLQIQPDGRALDRNSIPVADTSVVRAAIAGLRWYVLDYPPGKGPVDVTPTGLVTATAPAFSYVTLVATFPGTNANGFPAICRVLPR